MRRCIAHLAGAVLAASAGFAAAAHAQGAVRPAYALPGHPTSPALPSAYPPGDLSSFAADLDLPDPGHYQQEVVRVVEGGFFPATVAQLAVISPGEPVQVMLLHAQRRETLLLQPPGAKGLAVTSRKFGSMGWADFTRLRQALVLAVSDAAARAQALDRDHRRLHLLCTDDGGGSLAYGSGREFPFTVTLGGCGDELVKRLELRVLGAAESLTRGAPEALP